MEIKTEFLGMKMTKFKMETTLDGSNRLDTPEERISELEYLQKPSNNRGRKETRRKEEKQHTSGFGANYGKGVWKGRRKPPK